MDRRGGARDAPQLSPGSTTYGLSPFTGVVMGRYPLRFGSVDAVPDWEGNVGRVARVAGWLLRRLATSEGVSPGVGLVIVVKAETMIAATARRQGLKRSNERDAGRR